MKKFSILFLLAILLSVQTAFCQQKGTLTVEQKAWLVKAEKHQKAGWTYLHIEGKPFERGFQHGYLLAADINDALRKMSAVWHYQTAIDWKWLVEQSDRIFTPGVDTENMDEMKGIVSGMAVAGYKTTIQEIIAYNASTEFMGYWWPMVKDSLSPNSPDPKKESCSSFIATGSMTSDGNIVLGHNTMTSFYYPDCNLVLDIVPETGHRIMMQSVAGLIHSETDFFITDAGLVGSETTIGGFFPFTEKGIPEFIRMRKATQYASNIDEWCKIMKEGNNGGYANAWLIGDINTKEIARLELGLKYVGFERKKDGYFTGSNIAENLQILRFETVSDEQDIRGSSVARRVRWKQLMRETAGNIDLEAAKLFEADHYDSYVEDNKPGIRTLCAHPDLDPDTYHVDIPYAPWGTVDGKVVDATLAKKMSFSARWGSACGTPFNAVSYLRKHPQFDWMEGLINDRPSQPWSVFTAGEKK